jgi:cytochrome c-type biogenesis protein CcmH
MRIAAVVCLLALACASSAGAAARPTLAQLEHEVMCPTCHTLLELSHAPVADRMRAFIRRRIAAGDSDAEIKRRLVAQFGEGVLAVPPIRGFGLLAWLLPAVGFLGVGAIIAVTLRCWRRESEREGDHRVADAVDPALARALDRALAEYDG